MMTISALMIGTYINFADPRTERPYAMAYTISSALAIYFVLWWVVLFVTLPFGIRSQHEDGDYTNGTDPGAPVASRMRAKVLWTTLISLVIFAGGYGAFRAGYLNIERLSQLMGLPI